MASTTAPNPVRTGPPFLWLPNEIIHEILLCLSLTDLISAGKVNQLMQELSRVEGIWESLAQQNGTFSKPSGLSWRDLYIAHHPFWYIPRQKIWFSNRTHTGDLIIARYNHNTNAIEAYPIYAERRVRMVEWSWNPTAIVNMFQPEPKLDMALPVIYLDPLMHENASSRGSTRLQRIPMPSTGDADERNTFFSRLSLTYRRGNSSPTPLEALSVWPELTIFGMQQALTWATLPEEVFTPTRQKPWQGIWCADYEGHGVEWILVTQPDCPLPLPDKAERAIQRGFGWITQSRDTADNEEEVPFYSKIGKEEEEEREEDTGDESVYHGRLEAIKLTGDPNVPRGEYTWIAPDIGPAGLLRIAGEAPFKGARVVKSIAQLAGHGFTQADYRKCQLIMISYDQLAVYWEPFGHVSFLHRVNIDEFLSVP